MIKEIWTSKTTSMFYISIEIFGVNFQDIADVYPDKNAADLQVCFISSLIILKFSFRKNTKKKEEKNVKKSSKLNSFLLRLQN